MKAKTSVGRIIGIFMVLALVLATLHTPSEAIAAGKAAANRKAVLKIVNSERKKNGRGRLVLDSTLSKAAQKRAKEIAKHFSHERPDGSDCFTVLKEYDISYDICGENIAAGYSQSTAAKVMDLWMNSEGHRKNILYKQFNKIGVGYYKKKGTGSKYYWVQIFSD